jgi:hypothetical protein
LELPPFQLGQRASSLTPRRADWTCMPQPAQVAFPQARHLTCRHIVGYIEAMVSYE